jgi:hypothetical protein
MTGDFEKLRQLGGPIEVVGDIARTAICSRPGHRLLIGDFSGIESRALAWVTDEPTKLAQWARFDQTHDPADDPYLILGRALGHPTDTARAFGKTLDLAFGFQGGLGAYKNRAGEDDTATDLQIEAFKQGWRDRHPHTVQFWWGIDRAAVAAVKRSPDPITYGRLTLQCEQRGTAKFLFITLPSGRRLSYPFAKIMTNRFNRDAVEFMDNSLTNGAWVPCNHGAGAYGGLWTENIVQGIARDLLAAAMLRLEAAGYPVVLHVHDEIVCELPEGKGSLAEFKCLIEQLPEWATGLPVAAKVRNGPRFAEVDVPVTEHIPGAVEATRLPARAKAKTAKRAAPVGPVEALPLDSEMVARVIAWAIEREAIRKRKESGQPWPWTDDPILRAGAFCNVHREHDRVSRQIAVGLVQPFRNIADLWFAVTIARCVNEPGTLSEIENWVPFDPAYLRGVLEARKARGEKVYRTDAYKPPLPPRELKGMSITEHLVDYVLGPMWRERETLCPRVETLTSYSDRLRECYRIGPFLAGQIIADLKHAAPLSQAADWWTFAVPGPGSERGLNRVCGRPVKASWSEPQWHATLLQLGAEIKLPLEAAGVAPLDAQNLQNVLCEYDKYERAREKGGKPPRRYKPAGGIPPVSEMVTTTAAEPVDNEAPAALPETPLANGDESAAVNAPAGEPEHASSTQPAGSRTTAAAEPPGTKADDIPPDLPAAITADQAEENESASNQSDENASNRPPPGGNEGKQEDSSYSNKRRARGTKVAEFLYLDAAKRPYILVRKYINAANEKYFLPFRPEGGRWRKGIKNTPWARKIPYRLPELIAALATDSNVLVWIAEGEKDADRLVSLGLIATTNQGGAIKGAWTPELTGWFKALSVRRAAVLEDHDKTGEAHALEVVTALAGTVRDLRIIKFHELPEHGDASDWLATHSKDELLGRWAATPLCNSGTLDSIRASLVEMDDVEWLWANRFALGKIGIIAGLPDEGKGNLLAYIAARCTNSALSWPINEGCAPQGNVLLFHRRG